MAAVHREPRHVLSVDEQRGGGRWTWWPRWGRGRRTADRVAARATLQARRRRSQIGDDDDAAGCPVVCAQQERIVRRAAAIPCVWATESWRRSPRAKPGAGHRP